MSKPPKIDRKDLKAPDAFMVKGKSAFDWMLGHQHTLSYVIGGVLLVAGIWYGVEAWQASTLEKGWTSYQAAMKQAAPQKWEDLKRVAGEHSGSRAGLFAQTALAENFYEEAKKAVVAGTDPGANADGAVEWFGKAAAFGGLLQDERQLLLVNKGNALELKKKYDEAMVEYKAAADLTGQGRAWALLNLARMQEAKGDSAKAIETYDKISIDFANSEYGKQAKGASRRLKSPLFTPQKAG